MIRCGRLWTGCERCCVLQPFSTRTLLGAVVLSKGTPCPQQVIVNERMSIYVGLALSTAFAAEAACSCPHASNNIGAEHGSFDCRHST